MFQGRLVPGITSLSLLLAAFAVSQSQDQSPYGSNRARMVFEQYRDVFNKAKSIRVAYESQMIGDASVAFEAVFAKPNLGYVKGRTGAIYLNGREISIYNGRKNTYYKLPQTPANVSKVFRMPEYSVWQIFVQPNAYQKAYEIRSDGFKVRKGMNMQVITVQMDLDSLQVLTLYTDPQGSLLRQAEFVRQEPRKTSTTLIDIKDFKTDVDTTPTDFEFQIPEGAVMKVPETPKPAPEKPRGRRG